MVEATETAIFANPEWRRKIVGTLLLFLRIRNYGVYQQDLDCLIISARQMQKHPQMEKSSEILLIEADIASGFPKLTKPEAAELDDYFVSLLTRFGESLAKYLADKLGGKLCALRNVEEFSGTNLDRLVLKFDTAKLANDNIEEDFKIIPPSEIGREALISLIRSYFESTGFRFLFLIDELGIMFRKDETEVVVCVTNLPDEIFITVNVYKF